MCINKSPLIFNNNHKFYIISIYFLFVEIFCSFLQILFRISFFLFCLLLLISVDDNKFFFLVLRTKTLWFTKTSTIYPHAIAFWHQLIAPLMKTLCMNWNSDHSLSRFSLSLALNFFFIHSTIHSVMCIPCARSILRHHAVFVRTFIQTTYTQLINVYSHK